MLASRAPLAPLPSHTHRVLIADDNHDAGLSLSMLLQMMGHGTRIAHDGLEAAQLAEAFRPDVGMPARKAFADRVTSRW